MRHPVGHGRLGLPGENVVPRRYGRCARQSRGDGQAMIEAGRGDLLTADAEALVNAVNTAGVMGKGIALQFKRTFPANCRAYRAACSRAEVRVGEMWVFEEGGRSIVNFPTKRHWRDKSRLGDIETGLDSLVSLVRERGTTSIALPALGCGAGGLAWTDVRPLIERACARIPQVRALVFAPQS
ncbi:macro domain-containing protein [Actinoplanes sp. NPDC048988]|uniref:macro domain-containing protein n=1 Tax=Actinoplanes sp. NPDC048988 TaxID=3363901 RepID=UPI0037241D63